MKSINKQGLHKLFAELKTNKQEDVFNELYNKCGNLVYKIAFSILRNKENSEEIKQMVFLKIWKINKKILPDKNEAITFLKKQKNTKYKSHLFFNFC